MVTPHPAICREKPQTRLRNRARRAVSIATAALLLAGAAGLGVAAPAEAATEAVGYFEDDGLTVLGGMDPGDGTIAYCVNIGVSSPIGGSTSDAGIVGSINGLDSDSMSRLNYLLGKYGNTEDNNQAAAVALAVWNLADHDTFVDEGGVGYKIGAAPSSEQPTIRATYDAINADVASWTPGGGGANVGTLAFSVDTSNNYLGTLNVSLAPSNATGTVTLTNGVFDTNGQSSIAVTGSTTLAIHGVPPTENGTPYRISAHGDFVGQGGPGPNVHLYETPGAQSISAAGTSTTPAFSADAQDPQARSVQFQPVATTQIASTYVDTGDALTDTVQPATTADAAGTNNPWNRRTSGTYREVLFTGTIYGPFDTKPTESATVPVGTPIAGTASFTTTGVNGPTTSYTATADKKASGSGYYTWVWKVDAAAQSIGTQPFLPSGYAWSDRFGQTIETALVPASVVTTAKPSGTLGIDTITDTATVTGVTPVGATLDFDAYYQAPGTEPTCTAETRTFSSNPLTVDGSRDYDSDKFTPTKAGTYFWVETLKDASGTVLRQGECGKAGETSVITQLVVATTAQPTVVASVTATDTATMTGTITAGDVLTFQAYKQGDGDQSTDQLVCDLSGKPITLAPGVVNGFTITSSGCVFPTTGTYYWVETVTHQPTGTIVHRGQPRLPNETTQVTPSPPSPPTTSATPPMPATPASLALTGATLGGLLWIGGGLLAAGLLAVGALMRYRVVRDRRTAQSESAHTRTPTK